MTREEEIEKASIDYQIATNPKCIAGEAFADFAHEMNVNQSFIEGAKWADQHQKGLWDADKVTEWLKNNVNDYLDWYDWEQCRVNKDELLYDLRKAMEE